MKLITKSAINKLKNLSVKGTPHVLNVLVNKSTLILLNVLYKEGLIQSLCISNIKIDNSLFFVDIYFRVVGGTSMLQYLKTFNSRNNIVKAKSIHRLHFKQATVFVSTNRAGITTLFYLKKLGCGGTLLFNC